MVYFSSQQQSDFRAIGSICLLHICRAHLIQNLFTALVPLMETMNHTPAPFPFFFLLHGQACIFLVLHGEGPQANKLAESRIV